MNHGYEEFLDRGSPLFVPGMDIGNGVSDLDRIARPNMQYDAYGPVNRVVDPRPATAQLVNRPSDGARRNLPNVARN